MTLSRMATRAFSTTTSLRKHRALVYASHGDPSSVLRVVSFPTLSPPSPGAVNVRFLLSPVNPADVNTIQGVYPTRPLPADQSILQAAATEGSIYVAGGEGIAEVTAVGDSVSGVSKGDWVLVTKPQPGTWSSATRVGSEDVIRIDRGSSLKATQASMLAVNPPTAWNMLHDFASLDPGDWVLQNGANSAVGQYVIQFAANLGLKTLNFVRNRPDLDSLKQRLTALGATHIFTYDDLADKEKVSEINSLTGDKPPRLFLNCVNGDPTKKMLRLVGQDAHIVTYGAMAKAPLTLPAGAQIFQGLTAHGFWQTRWYETHNREERQGLMDEIVALLRQGKLKEAEHDIVTIPGHESDAQATERVKELMQKVEKGYGKKILLQVEDTVE